MQTKQEAILRNSIKGALRRCFSRCYIRREVLNTAIHPTQKGPRGGKQYTCSACAGVFSTSSVEVDHIEPVIPYNKTLEDMTWDELISRLFCSPDNLQVICKVCHKKKTAEERKLRRDAKRRSKTPKANVGKKKKATKRRVQKVAVLGESK